MDAKHWVCLKRHVDDTTLNKFNPIGYWRLDGLKGDEDQQEAEGTPAVADRTFFRSIPVAGAGTGGSRSVTPVACCWRCPRCVSCVEGGFEMVSRALVVGLKAGRSLGTPTVSFFLFVKERIRPPGGRLQANCRQLLANLCRLAANRWRLTAKFCWLTANRRG